MHIYIYTAAAAQVCVGFFVIQTVEKAMYVRIRISRTGCVESWRWLLLPRQRQRNTYERNATSIAKTSSLTFYNYGS